MELTHLSRGILISVAILMVYSFFFDSAIALIIAGSLLFTVLWRLYFFNKTMHEIISGIRCLRSASTTILRQGIPVDMNLKISYALPEYFHLVFTEQLPVGIELVAGNLDLQGTVSRDHTIRISYSVIPLISGSHVFPGLSTSISDPFFSDQIFLGSQDFSGPTLAVYPIGNFENTLRLRELGEQDLEQIRVVSGSGLRGYREFIPGDDVRNIDWKLTAKHDKPIVREYMGAVGITPLIIADLPEFYEDSVPPDFSKMIQAVASAADRSFQTYRNVSLLLISGPNLVKAQDRISDLKSALQILHSHANPVRRLHSMYRYRTTGTMRIVLTKISYDMQTAGEMEEGRIFLSRIARIISSYSKAPPSHVFQGEISRSLAADQYEDAYIFSLFSGDASHISILIEQLHQRHISAHLMVPGNNANAPGVRNSLQSGADTVTVFS